MDISDLKNVDNSRLFLHEEDEANTYKLIKDFDKNISTLILYMHLKGEHLEIEKTNRS